MAMYLIVKCDELGDQWECDADRTPMYITDDWKNDYPKNYKFEVWEIKSDNTLKLIKDYDYAMEEGMAYGYYDFSNDDEEDTFIILEKFKNKTRNDKCPNKIYNKIKKMDDFEDCLKSRGTICGYKPNSENNILYVYGEYYDSCMPRPW